MHASNFQSGEHKHIIDANEHTPAAGNVMNTSHTHKKKNTYTRTKNTLAIKRMISFENYFSIQNTPQSVH